MKKNKWLIIGVVGVLAYMYFKKKKKAEANAKANAGKCRCGRRSSLMLWKIILTMIY